MSVKMTRYKQAEFADEDSNSIGSIQMNEGISSTSTHIRYHTGTSSWRARTALEKGLLGLTAGLLLLLLIMSAVLMSKSPQRSRPVTPGPPLSASGPCLTESCIHKASEILYNLDTSVSPCDDFYAYACNGWIKNNPVPDGKSMWGTFAKLEQQNHQVVKNVLERPMDELKSKAEQKAKMYYQSCMDEDETIESLGAKPMLQLLNKIGGWNVTSSGFNVSTWSLQSTLHTLHLRYNMGGLFNWAVTEDDRNSTRHCIKIDQGGLTLPTRDSYLNKTAHEKILNAYLDYMVKISVLLGAEEKDARFQMAKVIEFETRLANITVAMEDRRDEEKLYHNMSLTELQERAPFINWRNYFQEALRIVNKKISEKEKVVVYAPEYLANLTNIIREYSETDDKKIVLNNYLVWQTVRLLASYLSKAFRDAYKGLRKAQIGSEGGEEPWRYCVTDTNNVIGFAVGAMFVREVFHGEAKPQAEEMINRVRNAFKENLKNMKWMDSETKKSAEGKADAISDMIGFPDYILNPQQLDEKYKDLNIDPKAYFDNNIKVTIFNMKKNLEKLDQPVNKTRWDMTPSTVNAYYTPTKNQIAFPAGILQMPFYDINNPKSLNFGAMGVVMGHELTHAFDDQGSEYDKDGNLHSWWNNKTLIRFREKTDCFLKQYSNYTINGKNINGKQTLGENIADNAGLKAAFHAFLKAPSLREQDNLPLPGLNLTHRQLFFISFAQVWCSAVTKEATTLEIEKDTHSPPRFRVIGPVSNLREFSEEFQCASGSRMNPVKKCEVW